jgi:hypothetical protein
MPLLRATKGTFVVAVVLSALGAAFQIQKSASLAAIEGFPGSPLQCLDKSTIEKIRRDVGSLGTAYSACRDELSKRLSSFHLDENGLKAAFAALAAHAMAPYGNSEKLELAELLQEQHLDCDNYAVLTGYFVGLLLPDLPRAFRVLGVQSKEIGNHAQVILRVGKHQHILADPTVGIIAETGYNKLLAGEAVPPEKIEAFYAFADPDIVAFGKKVYAAIAQGRYRPSDLLYYFSDIDSLVKWSYAVKPIFGAKLINSDEIASVLPTPGGVRLRRQLAADAARKAGP